MMMMMAGVSGLLGRVVVDHHGEEVRAREVVEVGVEGRGGQGNGAGLLHH